MIDNMFMNHTGDVVCQLRYSDFPGISFTVASSGEGLQQQLKTNLHTGP